MDEGGRGKNLLVPVNLGASNSSAVETCGKVSCKMRLYFPEMGYKLESGEEDTGTNHLSVVHNFKNPLRRY